jgi:hypothetical protein
MECESCTQRRGGRDRENRCREAERSRRDWSAKSQRGAERDGLRKADRRRTHGGREIARAAISIVGRERREEDLGKRRQLLAAGLLTKGYPQNSGTFEMLVYSGRLMDGKHALFVPLETFLSLPRPLDGCVHLSDRKNHTKQRSANNNRP